MLKDAASVYTDLNGQIQPSIKQSGLTTLFIVYFSINLFAGLSIVTCVFVCCW